MTEERMQQENIPSTTYGTSAMPEYTSIKKDIFRKLEPHLPYIREQFGIETIGLFGSVSQGEDTPESDIDLVISFQKGHVHFSNLVYLGDYLEDLFCRKVDLIMADGISKYMRPYIEEEVIPIEA